MATVTRATVTKGKNSNRPVGNSKSSSNFGKNNGEESKIGNQEAGTRAKGSSPQVSTTKTQNAEENKKLLLNKIEILKHWFLLDYDLVAALNKENHSLIPMAEARVNYLIGLVPDKLLAEGIRGEEEALWSIHELLYNNGCWEKASNLVVEGYDGSENGNYTNPVQGFLNSYAHLIHPNTKVGALRGNREAVRMALNQIHYSTIETARESLKARKTNASPRPNFHYQLQEARKFISSLSYLVEPTVFKDAMKGSDKALSLALGQIHHKTLPNLPPKPPLKTYKEALQSPVKKLPEKEMPPPKFAPTKMAAANTSATSGKVSIFFTGFDETIHARELWQMFKKAGTVKDIILPRRKDRFGNKFGFVIASNFQEAEKIIGVLNGRRCGNSKFHLAFAKGSRTVRSPKAVGTKSATSERSGNRKNTRSPSSTYGEKPSKKFPKPEAQKEGETLIHRTDKREVVFLDLHDQLQVELNNCVLLTTVKTETTANVEMIVHGLGFKDAVIRGLSNKKFLAYFPHITSLDDIDLDFLEIGFMEVSRATSEDLIPPRQAWIEIKGLPIQGWTEDNYRKLIQPWGEIIHFGRTIDEDGFYVTHKLLIETMHKENICEATAVNLLGKAWKVFLVESWGTGGHLQEEIESQHDYLTDEVVTGDIHKGREKSIDKVNGTSNDLDEEGEDGSCINPATPRYEGIILPEFKVTESPEKELPLVARHRDEQIAPTEPQQQEGDILQETVLHTSNWMPREIDSSSSFPISSTEVYMSEVENEIEQTVSEDGTHCSEVLAELKNLKVQVKRGRPRKYQKPQLNKHFKLPRKKKTRGEGPNQTSHFFLNAGFDEAEAIYETGTMMGLLTSHSKERSIEIIKANLQ